MSNIISELKSERHTWEETSISQEEAGVSPYNKIHAAFMGCFLNIPSQADNKDHIHTHACLV